ncbi:MAG: Ribonuclease H [Candidatus Izimaplasma bacterium HR2]|nr:MAG: Ribonuclease H [Candidatus Izimaplasma bacterium HR2]
MGYEKKTTNNRMELTAVIMALETVTSFDDFKLEQALLGAFEKNKIIDVKKIRIIIYTDSSYVANAYNKK